MVLSRAWRWVEAFFLLVGVPLALFFWIPPRMILLTIWLVAAYCWVVLRYEVRASETRLGLGREALIWPNIRPILIRFAISAGLMMALTLYLVPDNLFSFPREKPGFWLLVMVLYPILSVLPQEVIFRVYFFARYKRWFTRPAALILASGVAFGFGHVVFHNWVAPLLCLVGGVYFAHTYQRTKSLLLVSLEHALYGDFLFTVGLGHYFYHGSIAAAVH